MSVTAQRDARAIHHESPESDHTESSRRPDADERVRRDEAELWGSLSGRLLENVRHWEPLLRDGVDVLHTPGGSGHPECIIGILHLSRINPARRPPNPNIQVSLQRVEDGAISEPQVFWLDVTTSQAHGERDEIISLALLVTLTDPAHDETRIEPHPRR